LLKEIAASLPRINLKLLGAKMNSVAKISAEAVPGAANDLITNVMAVICGLGLVVLACVATSGLDTSVGFF
jgi:hypothetical protein